MGDDAKLQSASAFVIHVFRRGAFPTERLRTSVTVTGTAGGFRTALLCKSPGDRPGSCSPVLTILSPSGLFGLLSVGFFWF